MARLQISTGTSEVWEQVKHLIKKGEPVLITDEPELYFGLDEGNPIPISEIVVKVKTTNEWLNNLDYIPSKGELVVYSDYETIVEGGVTKDIPSIKIGDGKNPVRLLSFITQKTSSQLAHSLTIGKHKFDGTSDVVIPQYEGECL